MLPRPDRLVTQAGYVQLGQGAQKQQRNSTHLSLPSTDVRWRVYSETKAAAYLCCGRHWGTPAHGSMAGEPLASTHEGPTLHTGTNDQLPPIVHQQTVASSQGVEEQGQPGHPHGLQPQTPFPLPLAEETHKGLHLVLPRPGADSMVSALGLVLKPLAQ